MGILDFLPATTDLLELERREHLETALRGVMSSRNDQGKQAAVRALVDRVGQDKAIELLLALFWEPTSGAVDSPITLGAVQAIRQIGKPAVDPLLQLAKSDNPLVRKRAAVALGKIGDKAAVETLITLTRDRRSFVREAAQDALDEMESSKT